MSPGLEIQAVAVVTAVAAALPGTYLVLRRRALVSDAISHALLPGIVIAFLLTGDLGSPLLVVAAAATGVVAVALIEALSRTGLVREDAAIGLVFPVLFSLGVLLISRYAAGVHLDTDAVLLGHLEFAYLDRFGVGGRDLGPQGLWVMGSILMLNVGLIAVAYKELKLATVDAALAAALGFTPALLHYGLMTAVSITAVGAFGAVGSILVVALMIVPPATAYLLAKRLGAMLWLSAATAVLGAVCGYWLAVALDASIAGSMAVALGGLFVLTFVFAPGTGLLAQTRRRARQRLDFSLRMLLVHLAHHQEANDAAEETDVDRLHLHLRWSPSFVRHVVKAAAEDDLVERRGRLLVLTAEGRRLAETSVVEG